MSVEAQSQPEVYRLEARWPEQNEFKKEKNIKYMERMD